MDYRSGPEGREGVSEEEKKKKQEKVTENKEKGAEKGGASKSLTESGMNISRKMDDSAGRKETSSASGRRELGQPKKETTFTVLRESLEKQNGGRESGLNVKEINNRIAKQEFKSEVGDLVKTLFNPNNILTTENTHLTEAITKMAKEGETKRNANESELAKMNKDLVREARLLAETLRPNSSPLERGDLTSAIAKLASGGGRERSGRITLGGGQGKIREAEEGSRDTKPLDDIAAKLTGSFEKARLASESKVTEAKETASKPEFDDQGRVPIEKGQQMGIPKEELERQLREARERASRRQGAEGDVDLEEELRKKGVVLHHETAGGRRKSVIDASETREGKAVAVTDTKAREGQIERLREDQRLLKAEKQSGKESTKVRRTPLGPKVNVREALTDSLKKGTLEAKSETGKAQPEEWKEWAARPETPSDRRTGIETPSAPMSVLRGQSELSKARNDIKGFNFEGTPLIEAAKKLNENGALTVLVLPGQKILNFTLDGRIMGGQAQYWQGTIGGENNPYLGVPSTNLPAGRTYVLHVPSGRIYSATDGRELPGRLVARTGESLQEIQDKGNYAVLYNPSSPSRSEAFARDIKGQNLIVIRVPSPKEMAPMRQDNMPDAPGVFGQLGYKVDEYVKVNEALRSSLKYLPASQKEAFRSFLSDVTETALQILVSPLVPNPILDASKRLGDAFAMARSAQTKDDIEASAQLIAGIFAEQTVMAAFTAATIVGVKAGIRIHGEIKSRVKTRGRDRMRGSERPGPGGRGEGGLEQVSREVRDTSQDLGDTLPGRRSELNAAREGPQHAGRPLVTMPLYSEETIEYLGRDLTEQATRIGIGEPELERYITDTVYRSGNMEVAPTAGWDAARELVRPIISEEIRRTLSLGERQANQLIAYGFDPSDVSGWLEARRAEGLSARQIRRRVDNEIKMMDYLRDRLCGGSQAEARGYMTATHNVREAIQEAIHENLWEEWMRTPGTDRLQFEALSAKMRELGIEAGETSMQIQRRFLGRRAHRGF